ncbi:hypothetical protein Tco_0509556 [Tanacetum coccineum]
MMIDKSWTTLKNRTSSQFNDGLDAFLERCKDHLDEYNNATNEPPETKNELEELLAKAGGKLYPGCDKSTLQYLSKLLHIKKELQDASKSSQESGENVPKKEVMKKVLDKNPVVGKEDEEYEESDDKEMKAKFKKCLKELQDAPKSSQESGENVPEKEVMKKVLDKNPVVGKEDEEYKESDDKEMNALDEHEEINDRDDSVE